MDLPPAVRLFHLTGGTIPLKKASAIGGLVVALSAGSEDILKGNVQRDVQSPCILVVCQIYLVFHYPLIYVFT